VSVWVAKALSKLDGCDRVVRYSDDAATAAHFWASVQRIKPELAPFLVWTLPSVQGAEMTQSDRFKLKPGRYGGVTELVPQRRGVDSS